jgi:hypothetical protein
MKRYGLYRNAFCQPIPVQHLENYGGRTRSKPPLRSRRPSCCYLKIWFDEQRCSVPLGFINSPCARNQHDVRLLGITEIVPCTMSKLITVFGSTGRQGGSVVRSLLSHPLLHAEYKIRAVTRDRSKPKAKELEELGVEVFEVQ